MPEGRGQVWEVSLGPSYLWRLASIWGFFRTLLGSALLMLGLASSVEDVPGHSDPFPGFSRLFFQLGYLLARIGQYTRCSWRRQSLMLTFASWDVFWGRKWVFRLWGGIGCGLGDWYCSPTLYFWTDVPQRELCVLGRRPQFCVYF